MRNRGVRRWAMAGLGVLVLTALPACNKEAAPGEEGGEVPQNVMQAPPATGGEIGGPPPQAVQGMQRGQQEAAGGAAGGGG